MNLMFELSDHTPDYTITESVDETTQTVKKKYTIRGVFATADLRNRNGRVYPKKLWEENVARYQNIIKEGQINSLCEWEHPGRDEVDPMEAVARINNIWWEGNYIMGEATILDNEKGNKIKTLLDNGVKIGISSRSKGALGPNNVVSRFKLTTFDLVASPSDYNAFMNGYVDGHKLTEGILKGIEFSDDADCAETDLIETETSETETVEPEAKPSNEEIAKAFKDFIKSL